MDNYSYYNKELLLSLKPKYHLGIYLLLLFTITIIILLFCLKTYDVFNVKGYVECNTTCNIKIISDINSTSIIRNVDFIKVGNKNIYLSSIDVSEVLIDEKNNINYQEVSYQVDQLDYGINKTIQDIKIYSNYDLIIRKIIKFIT